MKGIFPQINFQDGERLILFQKGLSPGVFQRGHRLSLFQIGLFSIVEETQMSKNTIYVGGCSM
jgi:hypothetical protein